MLGTSIERTGVPLAWNSIPNVSTSTSVAKSINNNNNNNNK